MYILYTNTYMYCDYFTRNWYDENGYFWMGLRRVSSSTRPGGPFRWHHDGSTLNMASDYQNWGTGGPPSRPNLTPPDGDGDCVHIGQPRTGQWNDDRCYINKNYICKMCEFSTGGLKLFFIICFCKTQLKCVCVCA